MRTIKVSWEVKPCRSSLTDWLADPKVGDTRLFRNFGNNLADNREQLSRRRESSIIDMLERFALETYELLLDLTQVSKFQCAASGVNMDLKYQISSKSAVYIRKLNGHSPPPQYEFTVPASRAPPVILRFCTEQTLLLSQKTNISPHFEQRFNSHLQPKQSPL